MVATLADLRRVHYGINNQIKPASIITISAPIKDLSALDEGVIEISPILGAKLDHPELKFIYNFQ